MPEWAGVEDVQLLKLAKDGDAEAFGEIYSRYAKLIFGFLYANLDSRLDAEDLTGEVFLRAWDALSGYREKGIPFSAFLLRVARNALYDHYRRSKFASNHVPIENVNLLDDSDPEEAASNNLEHEELRRVLRQLDNEDYRSVLILRFLRDKSPAETAQIMERSVGAVRVLQHRALGAVRKILHSDENEKDDEQSE
ncbi:MAG TPA: sigma-70 family RNA polymerase sigma factor [Anaerolineales bacterium]|jgi:RNA polymerase sigma-70 factor (ECF subfamily)|nr:sigma-70 family RNA polymerase sigma factor [Anaerolineales bacterium]